MPSAQVRRLKVPSASKRLVTPDLDKSRWKKGSRVLKTEITLCGRKDSKRWNIKIDRCATLPKGHGELCWAFQLPKGKYWQQQTHNTLKRKPWPHRMGYGPINWYVSRTHLHNNRGVLGLRAGQKGGVAKVRIMADSVVLSIEIIIGISMERTTLSAMIRMFSIYWL